MTRTNLSMSISADGYVAGPNQSETTRSASAAEPFTSGNLGPTKDIRPTCR
jgi:hypothetical protein